MENSLGVSKMSGRDKLTLLILALMSVFLFADQNAMVPVIHEIQSDFCTASKWSGCFRPGSAAV